MSEAASPSASSPLPRIGFPGLGATAGPVVRDLAAAGCNVTAFDPVPEGLAACVGAGAKGAAAAEAPRAGRRWGPRLALSITFLAAAPRAAAGEDVPEWKRKRVALERVLVRDEFRIYYTFEGESALPPGRRRDADADGVPDAIQNVALQLVTARRIYVEALGLRHPLESPRYAGRARCFDVHVAKMPIDPGGGRHGSAGDAVVNYNRPTDPPGGRETLTIDVSRDLPCDNLTPAHELFHQFQNGYSLFKNPWYTEGTARWAEHALRKGAGEAGPLPRTPEDKAELFARAREAGGFWNALALETDPRGVVGIPKDIRRLRYVGTRKAVVEDARLHGAAFMKSLLEELDSMDDVVSKDEDLDPRQWDEPRQRDPKNDEIIWAAMLNACRAHAGGSPALRAFVRGFDKDFGKDFGRQE